MEHTAAVTATDPVFGRLEGNCGYKGRAKLTRLEAEAAAAEHMKKKHAALR